MLPLGRVRVWKFEVLGPLGQLGRRDCVDSSERLGLAVVDSLIFTAILQGG